MCIVAGGWQLVEVYVDGLKYDGDIKQFKLVLQMPAVTTATVSDFNRTQPSGTTDSGVWSIENNGSILRLIPFEDTALMEDWIIESLTPRKLIMVLNRDTGIKEGPGTIEFVMEPF